MPHLDHVGGPLAAFEVDDIEEGGTLEGAQNIADHADSRTTKLYDRRQQIVLREDVERIRY